MNRRQTDKKVLIIHQSFPGEFKSIALHLLQQGINVIGIGKDGAPGIPDFPWIKYSLNKTVSDEVNSCNFSQEIILHAHAVLTILEDLKSRGYVPDVILAHPGWGETLYVKHVYPHSRLIHFCEWYHNATVSNFGFDSAFKPSIDDKLKVQASNAFHLLNLENCDIAISPNNWQKSQFSKNYHHKIHVAHEGVPIENLGPNPNAFLVLPNGKKLKAGDKVITYVDRNLEPHRGLHTFMRALPDLMQRHPDCEIVIVGGDDVSDGKSPEDNSSWRVKILNELLLLYPALPINHIHFVGNVPYSLYKTILQISAVHVHLSYPIVLSRSLLEAMATGCAIVASDTVPVKEVIQHGYNGLLVDFFSNNELSQAIDVLLTQKTFSHRLRLKGIESARKYSLKAGVAAYMKIMFGESDHTGSIQINLTKPQVLLHPLARRKSDRLHELGLTPKELEVLRFLVRGMEDKDISSSLQISHKTVSQHVSNIINKLGASNRTHAVAKIFNPLPLL